jgi:hypothetical protein
VNVIINVIQVEKYMKVYKNFIEKKARYLTFKIFNTLRWKFSWYGENRQSKSMLKKPHER